MGKTYSKSELRDMLEMLGGDFSPAMIKRVKTSHRQSRVLATIGKHEVRNSIVRKTFGGYEPVKACTVYDMNAGEQTLISRS